MTGAMSGTGISSPRIIASLLRVMIAYHMPGKALAVCKRARTMLRFSLASLFLITLAVAMVVAAIANPTYVWEQFLATGTLLVLIAITIWGICGRREFLVGCAIAGWG